jgi:Response regulators consisting of a CheY-like receiver domain and a winged-helix DNA-binding domain
MQKILIIEDDQSIADLLNDYLEISGYESQVCTDGTSGYQQILYNTYDLIILDIMLPGMDGFEILRRIRDNIDIPVLLVSAKKEEIDKIRGLGLGADDYITKPFSPSELVARVKAHIAKYNRLLNRNSDNSYKNTLLIRGLEIQKQSMRVFINNHEVTLAQKEFELLLFMAQNPNRVFNREELFERIWGMEAMGDSATVTVHIARIREKIETDPSNPQYIETVWGAGYRFKI